MGEICPVENFRSAAFEPVILIIITMIIEARGREATRGSGLFFAFFFFSRAHENSEPSTAWLMPGFPFYGSRKACALKN